MKLTKGVSIWWWKVRYTAIFMRRIGYYSLSLAWTCADASAEAGNHEDMTPADAVDEELSYWTD